jgi:hypothetical protein
MKFTLTVTVEMTEEQMDGWACRYEIEPTEKAILADLWGRDITPLVDGSYGRIVHVDGSEVALGAIANGMPEE